MAEKLDTLAGFFTVDEKPTGSKDPFALRRAALGVIRLVLENGLRLPLRRVFAFAVSQYPTAIRRDAAVDDLLAFFADRLKVHLREQGVRHDLVSAVFALDGERKLYQALIDVRHTALPLLRDEDYAAAMTEFARLREPVDAFFEQVTVNSDKADERANRLKLLAQIRTALHDIADFSKIET